MSVYQPGRILHQFSYTPTSIAANADTTILDSDTIRQKIAGKSCYLKIIMTGGGYAKNTAYTAWDLPGFLELVEYCGDSGTKPMKQHWPMPGDATARLIVPLFANYTPAALGDAGRWLLKVKTYNQGNAKQAATYDNAFELHCQIVEGYSLPFESVTLAAAQKMTTISNELLWNMNWRRATGATTSTSDSVHFHLQVPNGGFAITQTVEARAIVDEGSGFIQPSSDGADVTTARYNALYSATCANNATLSARPAATENIMTLYGFAGGVETDYEFVINASAVWR